MKIRAVMKAILIMLCMTVFSMSVIALAQETGKTVRVG